MRTASIVIATAIFTIAGCGPSAPAPAPTPTKTLPVAASQPKHPWEFVETYDEFKDSTVVELIMKPVLAKIDDTQLSSLFVLEARHVGRSRTIKSDDCLFGVCPHYPEGGAIPEPEGLAPVGGKFMYWIADEKRIQWQANSTDTCCTFRVTRQDLLSIANAQNASYRFNEDLSTGTLTPEIKAAFLDFANRMVP